MTVNINLYGGSKITATKDVLNWLSSKLDEAADALRAEGYEPLAKEARQVSWEIYEALKEAGLYD